MKTKKISLAIQGSWSIAYIKLVDEYPSEGGTAEILQERLSNGGSGYNLAVNISRLDPHISLHSVGTIGCDFDGEAILDDLKSHQISTTDLATSPDLPTGYDDITSVKKSGVATLFRQNGANTLRATPSKSTLSQVTHFYLSHLIDDIQSTAQELENIRKQGIHTIISLSSEIIKLHTSSLTPIFNQAMTIIMSLNELEKMTGEKIRVDGEIDTETLTRVTQDVMKICGFLEQLVIYFNEGAIHRKSNGVITWRQSIALPRSKISSLYGSPDAFKAGFIVGLLKSISPEKSLELAHSAAAASMMDLSASGGVWSSQKCLQLEERFGTRPPLIQYKTKTPLYNPKILV